MSELPIIVEILTKHPVDGVGVTEVAKRTGLSKGTAFRRLHDLVEAGWAEQTEAEAYILSVRFGELAESIRKGYLARADMITRRLAAIDAVKPAVKAEA